MKKALDAKDLRVMYAADLALLVDRGGPWYRGPWTVVFSHVDRGGPYILLKNKTLFYSLTKTTSSALWQEFIT